MKKSVLSLLFVLASGVSAADTNNNETFFSENVGIRSVGLLGGALAGIGMANVFKQGVKVHSVVMVASLMGAATLMTMDSVDTYYRLAARKQFERDNLRIRNGGVTREQLVIMHQKHKIETQQERACFVKEAKQLSRTLDPFLS